MIMRAITLAGGLAGAATTSQFPEFSQQYIQRLGGAVDALGEIVADFETSAAAVGLTPEAALEQMQGSAFLDRRQADMRRAFARYDALQADLAALQGAGPFMRAYHLPHLSDRQIATAAWSVYQPALPLTFAGLSFAGLGFVLGALMLGGLRGMLAFLFGRRGGAAKAA